MPPQRNFPNWLQEWMKLFEDTETPPTYAAWSGIWTIAAALQDNVYMPRGHDRLYPHIYVFLVGPSGGGKGYSGSLATKALAEIPDVNLHKGMLTVSFTISYLMAIEQANVANNRLNALPALALYSDELANSIGSGERGAEFLRGMTQIYNDALQSGTHLHKMRQGSRSVVSWLASATPRWLKLSIPPDMVDSGFVARVITQFEPTLSSKIVPELDTLDMQRWLMLIHDLRLINQIRGEFTLTPEARIAHNEWYTNIGKRRRRMKDQILMNMYGRDDEHALKIAMVLSTSRGDTREITEQMFKKAAELVSIARTSNIEIYRSIAANDDNTGNMYYVLEKLNEANELISHTTLYRRCAGVTKNSVEFNRLINILLAEELIEAAMVNKITYYRLSQTNHQRETIRSITKDSETFYTKE